MILLCGIPTEPPLQLVQRALEEIGTPYVVFNQRHFETAEMFFELRNGLAGGVLTMESERYALEEVTGVYSRFMDYTALPEYKAAAADASKRRHCAALHETLTRWCEVSPAQIVNRVGPMGSNSSKPYQAQLIRRVGLEVPETLITNDPEKVKEFRNRHGRIIYKSLSGVRSIVQTFEDSDLERLDSIRWCPTQFQEYLEGVDVRVHVVGNECFATLINSTATDYRYAQDQVGESAELIAVELGDELAEKCVDLTADLGLAFSGIDLMLTPDDRVYCFEVNPCPGYSYYEANTGQPISTAVARYLMSEN